MFPSPGLKRPQMRFIPGLSQRPVTHTSGFSKAVSGHPNPALYLVGTIQGQPEISRPTDEARPWYRITGDPHPWGCCCKSSMVQRFTSGS
jgi:hypothetical protein